MLAAALSPLLKYLFQLSLRSIYWEKLSQMCFSNLLFLVIVKFQSDLHCVQRYFHTCDQ